MEDYELERLVHRVENLEKRETENLRKIEKIATFLYQFSEISEDENVKILFKKHFF